MKENSCVMLVTDDEYQLPIITADSLLELCDKTGLSYSTVQRSLHEERPVRLPRRQFAGLSSGRVIRVDLSETD